MNMRFAFAGVPFFLGALIACAPAFPVAEEGANMNYSETISNPDQTSTALETPVKTEINQQIDTRFPAVSRGFVQLRPWPQSNGQQVVSGFALSQATHLRLNLEQQPRWILPLPGETPSWRVVDAAGQAWLITLERDLLQARLVDSVRLNPQHQLDPMRPPGLLWDTEIENGQWMEPPDSEGLVKSRPLVRDNACQLEAVLNRLSPQYAHGVFGEGQEPTQLMLLPFNQGQVSVVAPAGDVFETFLPMIVDDCQVLLTASNAKQGARLMLYSDRGEVVAESEPIGTGFRWLHQLGMAQFDAKLPQEIVAVRTPHIGGAVEFYQVQDSSLVKTASLSGYSSHINRSQNLNMALIGDFDNSGWPNLLVPLQSRQALALLSRSQSGLEETERFALSGTLVTNLAVGAFSDRKQTIRALALGTETGEFEVWLEKTQE